jgi:vacuolar-type H+-ATPase subunit I/STV1
MKYKIYKLVYNGVVVYVGKTKLTLNQRKWKGYKSNAAVQAIHKECDMVLIEETSDVSREDFWVQHYKDTLLNIRKGDTGLSQKEYREANREHRKQQIKEWCEANREHRKQQMKEYCEANREKIKEYREANREKIKEYNREYYQKNKKIKHI